MPQNQTTAKCSINAIPAFSDNYIWALTNSSQQTEKKFVVLVDPGDADVCIEYIEQHHLTLSAILITHHHADHVGGIKKLVQYNEEMKNTVSVFAPKHENIPCATDKLSQGDEIKIPDLSLSFQVLDLPGHTLGHIAYYGHDVVFCGDTLFSGGCGRLFEGTPQQMLSSLNKLSSLPERTLVYCTHEYTLANLTFALTVDPTNMELIQYYNQVKHLRNNDNISLPSSILREKQINPFLRCFDDTIKNSVNEFSNTNYTNEVDSFAALRKWKDNF